MCSLVLLLDRHKLDKEALDGIKSRATQLMEINVRTCMCTCIYTKCTGWNINNIILLHVLLRTYYITCTCVTNSTNSIVLVGTT